MEETQETEYKANAIVDSFARGVQLPILSFRKIATKLKAVFKDDQDFMCQYYKCFFFDTPCTQPGIYEKLTNFTIRFNDSIGYTIPPSIFLRETEYEYAEGMLFPVCELMIYGNAEDSNEDFVLGDIFSDVYYTLYNYTSQSVGFSGFVLEGLPVIEEKNDKPFLAWWAWILLIGGMIGVVSCLSYFYIQKKKNEKLRSEFGENYKVNKEEIDLDDY